MSTTFVKTTDGRTLNTEFPLFEELLPSNKFLLSDEGDGIYCPLPVIGGIFDVYDMIIDGELNADEKTVGQDICGIGFFSSINDYIDGNWDEYNAIINNKGYTKENGFDVQKVKEALDKLNIQLSESAKKSAISLSTGTEVEESVDYTKNNLKFLDSLKDLNLDDALNEIICGILVKYTELGGHFTSDSIDRDMFEKSLDHAINNSVKLPADVKPVTKHLILEQFDAMAENREPDFAKILGLSGNPVNTGAASAVKVAPPKDISAPLQKGFIPDGEGNVTIDLSKVAGVMEPVSATKAMNAVVDPSSPTASPFIPTQQTATGNVEFNKDTTAVPVTPQVAETTEPKMVQPEVKTRKSKTDLKDATPKPTVVDSKTVDVSKTLLNKYEGLRVIDDAIGDQFVKTYEPYADNGSYVKVNVYDKNDLVNPIERMGMVVDVNGLVFSSHPKMWPATEVAGKQVDFVPAIGLKKESIVRFLTGDGLEEDDYLFNENCAELNKFFNVRSMFQFDAVANDATVAQNTLKKISDEFKNKKRLRDAVGDGRLNMTDFKDATHFTLETDNKLRSYVGGELANTPENHVKFVCNGKGISISGK